MKEEKKDTQTERKNNRSKTNEQSALSGVVEQLLQSETHQTKRISFRIGRWERVSEYGAKNKNCTNGWNSYFAIRSFSPLLFASLLEGSRHGTWILLG